MLEFVRRQMICAGFRSPSTCGPVRPGHRGLSRLPYLAADRPGILKKTGGKSVGCLGFHLYGHDIRVMVLLMMDRGCEMP